MKIILDEWPPRQILEKFRSFPEDCRRAREICNKNSVDDLTKADWKTRISPAITDFSPTFCRKFADKIDWGNLDIPESIAIAHCPLKRLSFCRPITDEVLEYLKSSLDWHWVTVRRVTCRNDCIEFCGKYEKYVRWIWVNSRVSPRLTRKFAERFAPRLSAKKLGDSRLLDFALPSKYTGDYKYIPSALLLKNPENFDWGRVIDRRELDINVYSAQSKYIPWDYLSKNLGHLCVCRCVVAGDYRELSRFLHKFAGKIRWDLFKITETDRQFCPRIVEKLEKIVLSARHWAAREGYAQNVRKKP